MKTTGLIKNFEKIYKNKQYKPWVILLGCLSLVFVFFKFMSQKRNNTFLELKKGIINDLEKKNTYDQLKKDAILQVKKKSKFFGKTLSEATENKQADKISKAKYENLIEIMVAKESQKKNIIKIEFVQTYKECISNKAFLIFSIIVSLPMYVLMLIFSNPFAKYIFERLLMMIFVIFGVTFLVFTILYISPMDPAKNILGETATKEQIAEFKAVYGLDKSYIVRLLNTFKQLVTFDLGNTYIGNMDVAREIMNKFPVTLLIAFWSLVVAIGIAIPSGIISAIKQYSSFDYIFMFIALIGLSIPNFWLALMMILEFSIKMKILPATYVVGNWLSVIMPAFVLGTGMSATVARMTRSSMLEVKNSDYILTAKAKGLSQYKVVMKHILGNAMIPIVTVIGLQFGGMLGGSAVTEKGFNISGLGSFIVDRQFIPDIPVVLAGVVYISVVISLANLAIDILYAFLDPRIKSKMKNY